MCCGSSLGQNRLLVFVLPQCSSACVDHRLERHTLGLAGNESLVLVGPFLDGSCVDVIVNKVALQKS